MKLLLSALLGLGIGAVSTFYVYKVTDQTVAKIKPSLIKQIDPRATYGDRVIIVDGFYAGYTGCAENQVHNDQTLFTVWGTTETYSNYLPYIGRTWLTEAQYEKIEGLKCKKIEKDIE